MYFWLPPDFGGAAPLATPLPVYMGGGAGGHAPLRNLRYRFSHKGDPYSYDFGEILKFGGLCSPAVGENWALPPFAESCI